MSNWQVRTGRIYVSPEEQEREQKLAEKRARSLRRALSNDVPAGFDGNLRQVVREASA